VFVGEVYVSGYFSGDGDNAYTSPPSRRLANMSGIPNEFDPTNVASRSAPERQMYHAENASREPMKSVLENNPEIYFVPPKRRGDWGTWEFKPGSYYDTTVG